MSLSKSLSSRRKQKQEGLPLAISTPEWRFLSDDTVPLRKLTQSLQSEHRTRAKQGIRGFVEAKTEAEENHIEGTTATGSLADGEGEGEGDNAVGVETQIQSRRNEFLDLLGEELADETVHKEAIIQMLEEAIRMDEKEKEEKKKQQERELHEQQQADGERDAGELGGGDDVGSVSHLSKIDEDEFFSSGLGSSGIKVQENKDAGGGSDKPTYTVSINNKEVDVSHFVKNPRHMRQIREVARRTSLGTIQGAKGGSFRNARRRSAYKEPKKVPAVFADGKSEKDEDKNEFWTDDEDLISQEDSLSPRGVGQGVGATSSRGQCSNRVSPNSKKNSSLSPRSPKHAQGSHALLNSQQGKLSPGREGVGGALHVHGGENKYNKKMNRGGMNKEKESIRPQSPVIIWRPNAAVRLATDLPRECLNRSILNPQEDMKLSDLIKSDRGFDPSLLKAQGTLPPEMKKTFSYYKQFVSNTMPSADEEKEVLSSNSRPEWGKRIPPSPKSEYGAWYIPPELWESDMRMSTSLKEKKVQHLRASMQGTHLLWNNIFDVDRKGGVESGLTELEVQEAQISEEIPNQYSSKMYKEFIRKKNGRLPHYLERVPSPPPEAGKGKLVNQNGSPRNLKQMA